MLDKHKIRFLLIWSFFFPCSNGFTEPPKDSVPLKSEMFLGLPQETTQGWQLKTAVTRMPGGSSFAAKDTATNDGVGIKAEPLATNLWLLVDSSSLCETYRVPALFSSLVGQIKRELPGESLVSIVTFSQATSTVLLNHKPVSEADRATLVCEKGALSTSFERALNLLVESRTNKTLPVVVWVLSSGNVRLSQNSQKTLRENDIAVNVLLYNPMMETDIRPLIDQMNLNVGLSRLRMSSVTSPLAIPERWYQLEVSAPKGERGKAVSIEVKASGNGLKANAVFSSRIPSEVRYSFWQKYSTLFLWILVIGLGFFLILRLIRFYRPKHCPSCHRLLRYEDEVCLFCTKPGDGFLVGEFNFKDRHKEGKQDVFPIAGRTIEIGPHRRSHIRLLPRSKKSEGAIKIHCDKPGKEAGAFGMPSYRLDPFTHRRVKINGRTTQKDRYLAHGDRIELGDDLSLVFLTQRAEPRLEEL